MGEMRQQQITVSLVTNADFTGDRHVADMNLWNLYKIIKEGLDKGNVQYMNLTVTEGNLTENCLRKTMQNIYR